MMWMAFFTWGQLKKMSNQRHILDSAELDGEFSRIFFLLGRNPN